VDFLSDAQPFVLLGLQYLRDVHFRSISHSVKCFLSRRRRASSKATREAIKRGNSNRIMLVVSELVDQITSVIGSTPISASRKVTRAPCHEKTIAA
jgi:hypothetical protein